MSDNAGPFDYRSDLERRVRQFAQYLKLMDGRAHEEAHGPCFIIFEERRPASPTQDEALVEQRRLVSELATGSWSEGGLSGLDDSVTVDLPDEGWREDDSMNRYIQFSFERNWFCMDMVLETLFRPEAEEILSCRRGFFYLRDRQQFTLYGEDVEGHDPFRKIYIYGDEDSATEDMAFIFFRVWKFPADTRLYVTAAAFSGKKRWEQGFPIA